MAFALIYVLFDTFISIILNFEGEIRTLVVRRFFNFPFEASAFTSTSSTNSRISLVLKDGFLLHCYALPFLAFLEYLPYLPELGFGGLEPQKTMPIHTDCSKLLPSACCRTCQLLRISCVYGSGDVWGMCCLLVRYLTRRIIL
jgi:hypothetical protein